MFAGMLYGTGLPRYLKMIVNRTKYKITIKEEKNKIIKEGTKTRYNTENMVQ
jgi:hypothetical protein